MNGIILDTHAWIWFMSGDTTLSQESQQAINAHLKNGTAFVAAISQWELCMLEGKGRIQFNMPAHEWVQQCLNKTALSIIELRADIAYESCHLPDDFHGDSADRLIVATARIEGLELLTRDKQILRYSKNNAIATIGC